MCPSPRNPRRHPAAQVQRIADAMRSWGWTAPVLIAADGEIIAGEARWKAAGLLKLAMVPVVVLPHLDERGRDAVRLADNRLAMAASWDEELLARVLRDLETLEVAAVDLGFDEAELAALMADPPAPPAGPEVDQAEAPSVEPTARLGDVWGLGRHRLVCGDATDPATFARLFAEGRPAALVTGMEPAADLVWTDPPYGMSYKGRTHGGIIGDDARGGDLVQLVTGAVGNAVRHARPGAAVYVCLTWRTYREFAEALEAAGIQPAACIVWDKGWIGPGTLHYRPRHEWILYGRGKRWYGGRGEGDVWTVKRDFAGDYVHPTQKPVALVERALANSSIAGDVVLDVFGGSGSTMIACERLGRQARLVELDPRYCDAIIRRWETFTGSRATRLA